MSSIKLGAKMKKPLLFGMLTALGASLVGVSPAYAATSLTVDLSSVIGPVTHSAAGSLYGVIENQPDNNLILPLHA